MNDEIYETPSTTPNFQTELAAQLADLIPEVVADGKVDVAKLKELLDGDAADTSERYGLFWPGKKRALRAAQEPTAATLKPDFENSKEWDTTKNVFIEGDNLEVLKILQKHYHAKIKLIYIDPPYNTGKDFVYPDNYKEGLETYLEWTRQVNEEGKKVSTNAETEGRYHSNWLNMMYPRLKLARNLLTHDGVIFISIDDNEQTNLKKLCDEIFGENNFLAQVIIQSNKRGQTYKEIAKCHEYLLVYYKSEDGSLGELEKADRSLPYTDKHGGYDLWELRNRNPKFGRHNRPNLFYPIYVDANSVAEDGLALISLNQTDEFNVEVFPRNSEGGDSCWRWGKEKLLREGIDGNPRAAWAKQKRDGGWNIYEKSRKSTTKAKSIWTDTKFISEQGTVEAGKIGMGGILEFPKPMELIRQCVFLATDKDDIVLDFFAGSGTTAHAVLAQNMEDGLARQFICVQLPEPTPEKSEARQQDYMTISDIARRRIQLAGDAIKAELRGQSVDVGFKSYSLTDTNFSKWQLSSDVEKDALQQHLLSLRDSATDDATTDELLTEILLKQGYSLTETVAAAEVDGLDVRLVRDRDGDVAVLAYLNEHIKPTLDQLRALVDASPTRIIVLEDAFQGDDELKTNLVQLAKSKGIELWTT
ncbi:site-specific DNA-methyltransferase [Mycolicibacterium llatzerense]|uniref:site-specific DNA-methyltransferase n=1 Tax=Mycolicibacterium llatzerense TaxID=280871 RepID=UPI0021B6BBA1|nr:DNA methyltransferase [Mycolicibacterium llatzerense]MCT7372457.1 DNA methyltransferase [Mycolicibacterium llatzerense]